MLTARTALSRRVIAALDASPSRIPVLLGGCGSGRTTMLQQVRERLGRTAVQYIDVERTATTPERFLRETIEDANRRIHDLAHADASRAGMGTTITAAIVDAQKEEVGIGHVGDSRAYRLRRGRTRVDDFFAVFVGSILAVLFGIVATLYVTVYFASPAARITSARPGASRSITARVASGVTSRGPKPVPPVVTTSA